MYISMHSCIAYKHISNKLFRIIFFSDDLERSEANDILDQYKATVAEDEDDDHDTSMVGQSSFYFIPCMLTMCKVWPRVL